MWLIYCDNDFSKKKYPNAYAYLEQFKQELLDRRGPKNGEYEWWRLHRPAVKEIHDAKEKLVVPYRAEHNRFAYDDAQYFNDGGDIRALVVKEGAPFSIKYLLALLNSMLLDWYFGFIGKAKGNSREYFNKPLAEIPIKPATHEEQEKIISLVDAMISVKKRLSGHSEEATRPKNLSPADRKVLEQRVDLLDRQINALVYKLYGLTAEEIAVVESRK